MRLSDIRGQDVALRALRSSLRKSFVAHAYLFAGPACCGKTSTALAFASALNCAEPTADGDSCGVCLSCLRIEAGSDADVRVISPEGQQTKMEQMQDMIKDLSYAPISGRRKVFIIEQADTLNPSSENCVLKMLEEPPAFAVLILLTRNPGSLLPTIRSRCRLVRFYHSSAASVRAALLERELDIPEETAATIAACSQGAVGAAFRMAEDKDFMADRAAFISLLQTWADGPIMLSFQTAERIRELSRPPRNAPGGTLLRNLAGKLDLLLSWYSDLLHVRVNGEPAVLQNSDFVQDLAAQASRHTVTHLRNSIRSILDSRRWLEGSITPQLVIENLLFEIHPAD